MGTRRTVEKSGAGNSRAERLRINGSQVVPDATCSYVLDFVSLVSWQYLTELELLNAATSVEQHLSSHQYTSCLKASALNGQ